MIDRFYRQLENIHINCEKPRAYFVPFDNFEDSNKSRDVSKLFTLLNGEWDFEFFNNVEELDIENEKFTDSIVCHDKMVVPFCWQLCLGRGYDVPNYINQDYPYPVDPPFLPDIIPCGFYRRKIDFAKKSNKKYYINFEGVASCFYLWVNGSFKGYSQVSHCTSEFEITDMLVDGENKFEILVVKHCTGSYMEDQDFFRLSGIFRDVYILERDEKHIEDIFIQNFVSDDFNSARLTVDTVSSDNLKLSYYLLSPDGEKIAEGNCEKSFEIQVNNPALWNAENPKLYTLYINCGNEYISFPVGLKRIEIKNRVLLLNGKKIKIRGINRHDSHPEKGYAVSVDDMIRDLKILKQGNVNAIRTSHYPNDPRFLEMCDKMGFMIIDEADLETHGMGYNYGDWYWDHWAFITTDEAWKNACVDRAERLFERDKNHGCVIMWSLGNESGCGENHRHMANYIRSRMPYTIIHYENAHLEYQERLNKDFTDISDVESRMYAPLDYLEKYLNNPEFTKPFFYCEYVAAWSTGDIPLHWDKFEEYDNYCGGCVWEFTDHAVNIGTVDNPKYRFGGDFGDYPNDYIYCVDGLVYPDRSLRPGFHDMKICYQPFSATYNDGKITLKNKRYFTSLNDIEFKWSIETNGKEILSGMISETDIEPQGEKVFELFNDKAFMGFTTLNLVFTQKSNNEWAEKGFEIGHIQFILNDTAIIAQTDKNDKLNLSESRTKIEISCGNVKYIFDKITGKIISINTGKELLSEPLGFSLNRSYHPSNGTKDKWLRARYHKATQKTYKSEIIENTSDKVAIKTDISFASAAMPTAVKATAVYTFSSDGKLNISVSANVTERAPELPRFGIELTMPKDFESMSYIGYGPVETYCDRFRSQTISEYNTTVSDNFEHYIKPTESSAHYKTKTAKITDNFGHGLIFEDTSKEGFLFNAKHYSDGQLLETRHDDELCELDKTIINIDYKMHSDCPDFAYIEPWRTFDEKEFSFSYNIIAF